MTQDAIVSIVVVLLVVARFLFRELRERRIRTARIYVVPAVLGLVALVSIGFAVETRPQAWDEVAAACLGGLALGGAFGYAVAHFTTVRVTSEPAILYARGSLVTVAIWVVALLLRLFARFAFAGDVKRGSGGTFDVILLNAALLVLLASALFFVRYRLLAAARLERSRGITVATPIG
jgi:hypothetical protein